MFSFSYEKYRKKASQMSALVLKVALKNCKKWDMHAVRIKVKQFRI